jgi:hypothetical protein
METIPSLKITLYSNITYYFNLVCVWQTLTMRPSLPQNLQPVCRSEDVQRAIMEKTEKM